MEAPVYKEVEKRTNKGYECYIDRWGTKGWWLNGERHREDGPAVEYTDGTKVWFLNGEAVSEKGFNEVWNCPLDRLPLYINTEFAPIMRRRLSNGSRI